MSKFKDPRKPKVVPHKNPKKPRIVPQSSTISGIYFTEEGIKLVYSVMTDLKLTQTTLGEKMGGIPQATISSWLSGKRRMHPVAIETIYNSLGEDERLRFITDYLQNEPKEKWAPYIISPRMKDVFFSEISNAISLAYRKRATRAIMEIEQEEKSILRPLYTSFVKQYTLIEDKNLKLQMCNDLEELVNDYKKKSGLVSLDALEKPLNLE